jgi:hypothetical protein
MSKDLKIEKEIALVGTKNGKIFVSKIDSPYGNGSDSVASVAVSLSGSVDSVDWKVHIPIENIDDVCEALKGIK